MNQDTRKSQRAIRFLSFEGWLSLKLNVLLDSSSLRLVRPNLEASVSKHELSHSCKQQRLIFAGTGSLDPSNAPNAKHPRNKEPGVKGWIHRIEAVGVEDLEEMARECRLLGAVQSMSPQLFAYTQAVVEQCASIADAYPPSDTQFRSAHSGTG
jgi:hypothetical protein